MYASSDIELLIGFNVNAPYISWEVANSILAEKSY